MMFRAIKNFIIFEKCLYNLRCVTPTKLSRKRVILVAVGLLQLEIIKGRKFEDMEHDLTRNAEGYRPI